MIRPFLMAASELFALGINARPDSVRSSFAPSLSDLYDFIFCKPAALVPCEF